MDEILAKFISDRFEPLLMEFNQLKAEHIKLKNDYDNLVNDKNIKTVNTAFTYASIVNNKKNPECNEFKNCLLSIINNDLKQKDRKENNIIVSGVPKASLVENKLDTNKDNEYIKKIFDKLELDVNLIKKTSRVKTRDNISDENNPVLIELNDIDSKNKVMKNAHKLKGFKLGLEKFIFLNNDLTFAERSCEKHLRDERNRLNASLSHSDINGRYELEGGKQYYWAIRYGSIKKVFRK